MAEQSTRRAALTAEALGTAGLLAVVVGSGIMAERLAGGNVALALLANSIATGAGLYALIASLGPVSGAHFNPAVSMAAWWAGHVNAGDVLQRVSVQLVGAVTGVLTAHAMFGELLFQVSTKSRPGPALMLGELVATFGLLLVVRAATGRPAAEAAAAVAAYITGAYWFTSSTSFANPAVTLARALTDTFAGIRPADVPGFILAQLLAVALAAPVQRLLWPPK